MTYMEFEQIFKAFILKRTILTAATYMILPMGHRYTPPVKG